MDLFAMIAIGVALVLAAILSSLVLTLYQRCGANQALIISGLGCGPNGYKVILGGGEILLPLVQQVNRLSLEVMTIELSSPSPCLMKDGVPI